MAQPSWFLGVAPGKIGRGRAPSVARRPPGAIGHAAAPPRPARPPPAAPPAPLTTETGRMRLRLDELLQTMRDPRGGVRAAIDADPLLLKKVSGDLVLANAGKELFTPQHEHQLFAKGIVYRRDPYRLVSLPLVKIYN